MQDVDARSRSWMVWAFFVLGVLARLVPHPPNTTPVTAIALFGGCYLSKRWSLALPLLIVVFSDALIGWHSTAPFTWGAFLLAGALGWWVRARPTPWRIVGGTLAGSLAFFLVTNFGVWLMEPLYAHTVSGLWACYVAALPFFRNSLLGDLVYASVFFGAYALLANSRRAAGASHSSS